MHCYLGASVSHTFCVNYVVHCSSYVVYDWVVECIFMECSFYLIQFEFSENVVAARKKEGSFNFVTYDLFAD